MALFILGFKETDWVALSGWFIFISFLPDESNCLNTKKFCEVFLWNSSKKTLHWRSYIKIKLTEEVILYISNDWIEVSEFVQDICAFENVYENLFYTGINIDFFLHGLGDGMLRYLRGSW